eukprot:NODE_20820_length_781_cov_1.905199.p5 GENE.NODE_20820_length_781_cov_1.905199~~NODE_20820_length_781_cov_1.905199.p5  ORF type:complete len:88 (+),score=41.66 NODE_20820_length_781_cov_1.905199:462-725(+)
MRGPCKIDVKRASMAMLQHGLDELMAVHADDKHGEDVVDERFEKKKKKKKKKVLGVETVLKKKKKNTPKKKKDRDSCTLTDKKQKNK